MNKKTFQPEQHSLNRQMFANGHCVRAFMYWSKIEPSNATTLVAALFRRRIMMIIMSSKDNGS